MDSLRDGSLPRPTARSSSSEPLPRMRQQWVPAARYHGTTLGSNGTSWSSQIYFRWQPVRSGIFVCVRPCVGNLHELANLMRV